MGRKLEIRFAIAQNPAVAEAQREVSQALDFVQNDPKVRYALELFKGSIIKCEPLENEEQDGV